VNRWSELDGELPLGLDLTDDQLALIHEHEAVLAYIQTASRSTSRSGDTESTTGSPGKTVIVAVCPDCGRWMLVAGGTPPPHCSLNIACCTADHLINLVERAS
jgi:hypothetical protein